LLSDFTRRRRYTFKRDLDLLGQHARDNSQDAFAVLVQRHVNLVYSAALRQVRSPQLAEEIAQSVFTDLARNAGSLARGSDAASPKTLTPWLYAVTRRTAIDAIRKESRRQLREQIAVELTNMNATANDWMQIEPLLDDAMAALNETDRSAILLRYFENKSLREVGQALGTNDDAAQKRVSRGVERLREFFSKRNVMIGAGGLAVVISANAVQAAPIGLAATISDAVVIAGTAVSTSTVITATKAIAMTTLQKTVTTAALTAAVGTGIFEAHQAAQLREQNQTLQQQQTSLAEQIRQLRQERDDTTNQLMALLAENEQLKSNPNRTELLKLRGEIGALRQHSDDLGRLQQENRDLQSQIAAQSDLTNRVSTEDQFNLRQTHAVDAMTTLLTAFKNYTAKNNGQYPVNFDQLIASGELGATNFSGNLGLNDFRFAKDGSVDHQGDKIILFLRVPIQKTGKSSVTVSGDISSDGLVHTEIENVSSE
jgi:RNA polymerase sigma factor (sigma-70 family)